MVVVGAGIVGLCTALHLLRTGRTVVVLDRSGAGRGASGHNAGVVARGECVPLATGNVLRSVPRMVTDPLSPLAIRSAYLARLTPWLVRFARAARGAEVERISIALQTLTLQSVDAYRALLGESATAELIVESGVLHAYRSDAVVRSGASAHELRVRRGVNMRVLDDDGMTRLDPGLAGRFAHGVYMSDAASTPDPYTLTTAVADKFVGEGGRLIRAEVTGFGTHLGEVGSVSTAKGDICAGTVVIAAGAWSRRLTRMLGFGVPLDTERGYGVELPNAGLRLSVPVIVEDFHFAVRCLGEETRLIGISELAGLDAPPNPALWTRIITAAKIVFPELRVSAARQWMSYRPSMPDSLPVIGPLPTRRNVVLAFGHGHKGLGLGAVTGQVVAELVDKQDSSFDLSPYAPTRFQHSARRRSAARNG